MFLIIAFSKKPVYGMPLFFLQLQVLFPYKLSDGAWLIFHVLSDILEGKNQDILYNKKRSSMF